MSYSIRLPASTILTILWLIVYVCVLLWLRFADIHTFQVKIGESNVASLGLFQKLEFIEIGRSTVFKEVHLQKQVNGAFHKHIQAIGESLTIGKYDEDPGYSNCAPSSQIESPIF